MLEVFVPNVTRFTRGQAVVVQHLDATSVTLEASRHDAASQQVLTQTLVLTEERVRLLPVEIRYAWPSELDLMGRLAGLELEHRWAGWGKEPFGATSGMHVSVWRKPA